MGTLGRSSRKRAGPTSQRAATPFARPRLDTTAMRAILGFSPAYTTPQAFDAFAQRIPPGPIRAQRVADLERRSQAWYRR